MKKVTRLLKSKAIDSLLLSVEHFNRPWDQGRLTTVLILLDHSFEMLLKAMILHRGGRIREPRAKQTIGFDACVRKALSDASLKCLSEEQAITLQVINAQRDAAQHYLLEMSEQQLYMYTQAGVTLFADLVNSVFDESLARHFPERALPVSTQPPRDLAILMADEVLLIRSLLKPGRRKRMEARSRARSLAIMEGAVQGERVQPSTGQLDNVLEQVAEGRPWERIFPGVSGLQLDLAGEGLPFSLRITKREGVPITLVPEGTPGAAVVAVKRVDELGYYSIGHMELADKVGVTEPKLRAILWHLDMSSDDEYFREIRIGSSHFKRYSPKALDRLKKELPNIDLAAVWSEYR